jgi:hypothetical protein
MNLTVGVQEEGVLFCDEAPTGTDIPRLEDVKANRQEMGATVVSKGEHLATFMTIAAGVVIETPSETTQHGGSVSSVSEHGGSQQRGEHRFKQTCVQKRVDGTFVA